MVSFIREEESVYVRIGGSKFQELVAVLHQFSGKFHKNVQLDSGETLSNLWELDYYVIKDAAHRLIEVDPSPLPAWIDEVSSERDSDFFNLRSSLEPSLVKSEWKGEYQKRAVIKGISQNRLAIFHEMGLGKTFEIQTIINHLMEWKQIERYVVISPAEGVINFAREAVRFNSFGLTWDDIYLVDRNHRDPFSEPKKLTIMTYRSLIMLQDDFRTLATGKKPIKKVSKNYIPWDRLGSRLALILDESPMIKNPKSKTFHIIDKSKVFFLYRYIMTGTPAPKYAADLWTQFRFLLQRSVPNNYMTFIRTIACVGTRFSEEAVRYYYPDKVESFLKSVDYLVDRADLKTAGLELPPLIIKPVYCKMPPEQLMLYRNIVQRVVATVKEKDGKITRRALQNKYPYLSLALHDPSVIREGHLDEDRTYPELVEQLKKWEITKNGKYDICEALLERNIAEGKKTILFSGHPHIIDQLTTRFFKYRPYKLHAGTVVDKGESVAERNNKVVELFKMDKDSWVLIANYMVLKTAVNLTEAPRQIYWDRDWNADTFAQAVKRSHRIGQTESVIVNPLIFVNTLEEQNDVEIKARLKFSNDAWLVDTDSRRDNLYDPLSLEEVRQIFNGSGDQAVTEVGEI